jgi:hypothetical protein
VLLLAPGADHVAAEAGHLLVLRRELKQQQVDPGLLVLPDALGDLRGRADEPGAQAAVGDAVLLERDVRFELRPLDEVAVRRVGLR